jgi:DNA-binding SARP family transcriptional activator
VQQDELGGGCWQLPALIADALGLPNEIPNAPIERRPVTAQRTQVAVQKPSASLVEVHDLGPLTLDIAEGTIDGTSIRPRSLGLLLYLATRPRHAATREEAIEALWPDAEEDAGLNSLNQAIFHLRRTIDPEYDAARNSNVAYVRHEGEVVSLHPDLVRFDSAVLATGLDRLPRRPSAEEIDVLFDTYRGPFGMELPYETWVQSYRETLEVGLLSVAERAVINACDAGDLDRAVDLALRTTRIDPSDGALLERLALLLDETGAAASARRAARRAIALLDEVSVEVPVELLRLGSLPQKGRSGSTK